MKRALLVVPLLLLPACSSGTERASLPTPADPSSRPSFPAPSLAPSPSAEPVEEPEASPRVVPSDRPSDEPAPEAVSDPTAQGDVDGDDMPDAVTYEGRTAVVALTGGGTVRASVAADIEGDLPPATMGIEDVDLDGRGEVFVKVGQGSSTGFAVVLRYDGARLAPLTVDGQTRLLAYGGAATHGDGFACTADGVLVVRSAASEDGETYDLETVTYVVDGSTLVEGDRTARSGLPRDDRDVEAAYVVDCRSVGEGG